MNKRLTINSTTLKVIAMILILIDHIGFFLIPITAETQLIYMLFRGVGRLGFPLYAFFIVEGIFYSKNINKYLRRIFALVVLIFAFQASIFFTPLSASIDISQAYNVFLTLFTGATAVAYFHQKKYKHIYLLIPLAAMITTNILEFFVPGKWTIFLVNEYRLYGIAIIIGFYIARVFTPHVVSNLKTYHQVSHSGLDSAPYIQQINNYLSSISLLFINIVWYILTVTISDFPFDPFQTYSIFTAILILMYNGLKGYQPVWFKWVYYLYYPVHLAILAIISFL